MGPLFGGTRPRDGRAGWRLAMTTREEGTRTLGLILGELGLLGRLEGVGGGHVRLTALKVWRLVGANLFRRG